MEAYSVVLFKVRNILKFQGAKVQIFLIQKTFKRNFYGKKSCRYFGTQKNALEYSRKIMSYK